MFVVWKWTWANYDYNTASSVSSLSAKSTCSVDSEASSEASSDEPDIPFVTHSVVLKCIGSTKESTYQDTLALVKENEKQFLCGSKKNRIIQRIREQ